MNTQNQRAYYIRWAWRCRRSGWSRDCINYLLSLARQNPRIRKGKAFLVLI
jgi:hypothetical protein